MDSSIHSWSLYLFFVFLLSFFWFLGDKEAEREVKSMGQVNGYW